MSIQPILLRFLLVLMALAAISCNQPPIENEDWELVGSGFSFPEGPAWDSKGILYLSNCNGDWISKVHDKRIDTLLTSSDSTFSRSNGLFVAGNGNLFMCDFGVGVIRQVTPDGNVKTIIPGYQGKAFNRPNDLLVFDNGDIYFTDPKSYSHSKTDGRLFYYRGTTGTLHLAADTLAFPNGLGISPRDGKLYVCESAKNRILRFEITAPGTLDNREVFIELPGGDPDGIEFDQQGNLYVAHFGSGMVYIIDSAGHIIQQVKTPGKKPSNLEFGDSDYKTLYLTEDETNALYKIRVNNAGLRTR